MRSPEYSDQLLSVPVIVPSAVSVPVERTLSWVCTTERSGPESHAPHRRESYVVPLPSRLRRNPDRTIAAIALNRRFVDPAGQSGLFSISANAARILFSRR